MILPREGPACTDSLQGGLGSAVGLQGQPLETCQPVPCPLGDSPQRSPAYRLSLVPRPRRAERKWASTLPSAHLVPETSCDIRHFPSEPFFLLGLVSWRYWRWSPCVGAVSIRSMAPRKNGERLREPLAAFFSICLGCFFLWWLELVLKKFYEV